MYNWSCTLVYSSRRNVCRRNVVDEMSVDELSWNHNMHRSSHLTYMYLSQLFTSRPPRSTRSSSTSTILYPSVTLSPKICQSFQTHSCPAFGTNSDCYCNNYLIHPTNSPILYISTVK